MLYRERFNLLRTKLSTDFPNISYTFLVPHGDRFQSEYVHPSEDRLQWLTGFTGSAGIALVTQEKIHLFVDGRYELQAQEECKGDFIEVIPLRCQSPYEFVSSLSSIDAILYDPWLHTQSEQEQWSRIVEKINSKWQSLEINPIDCLWSHRPLPSKDPIFMHDARFLDLTYEMKIAKQKVYLKTQGLDGYLITSPASICWLLNIRGRDFPYNPLVEAFCYLPVEGPLALFVDLEKVTPHKVSFNHHVQLYPLDHLASYLFHQRNQKIGYDPTLTPLALSSLLSEELAYPLKDPCLKERSLKTPREIQGFRDAHLRDGVAVTKFLCWLDSHWHEQTTPHITEWLASEKLEEFRREGEHYQGPSFQTISAYGKNGAIVHYRCPQTNSALIENSSLYLLDSGGHYLDGTTDITRTICLGDPTEEQRRLFTLVLKGHINLASSIFPHHTTGTQLDAIARLPLWREGLDYDHGTGHGVGYFLSVHEGPQSISKAPNAIVLEPGMILSIEPGYYKPEYFGIRIENLVCICEAPFPTERPSLAFETLTLAPIDRKLVNPDMLTESQWEWFNGYQLRVREALLPHLDVDTAAWLMEATAEI